MSTLTVYPDAGTGTTCDAKLVASNVTWAGARAATTANFSASTTDATIYIEGDATGGVNYLGRPMFTWDTSALTAGATISAAVVSLYATGTDDTSEIVNPADPTFVTATPAAPGSLVAEDFDQVGSTSLCDSPPTLATFAGSTGYHDFTLNATGIAAVSKTGITQLAVRPLNDINNAAPTLRSYASFSTADTGGTTQDPKLVVTYTLTSTFVPKIIITMMAIITALGAATAVIG